MLAQQLNMLCVDLDSLIEEDANQSVAQIFATEGEAKFREREVAALQKVCGGEVAVIATGGGTPCQGDNLQRMKDSGVVVNLATELATALQRAGESPDARPLLKQSATEIETLYRERAPVYRRAQLSVSSEEKSPERIAEAIAMALACTDGLPTSMAEAATIVALPERSYPVVVQEGCLSALGPALRARLPSVASVAIVSDDNVMPLYGKTVQDSLSGAGLKVVSHTVPPGEQSKEIAIFSDLCDSLIASGLDRSSAVIALGGGVVGDLAGFAASCLFRGVPVIQVPTTLLAMTDSAIGGKTGINSKHGKNLVGAFWQPTLVWADPITLTTLSQRERRAAFGELVKYALLDGELWPAVERLAPIVCAEELEPSKELAELVRACAGLKAAIVSADERESGLRATLNLGHTIGHAIEAHAGYGQILHGEAVALGLLATCRVSHRLGLCDEKLESQVAVVLKSAGLAADLEPWLKTKVLDRMGVDKKRTGSKVRFIAVVKPGDVRRQDIELTELTGLLLAD